MRKLKEGFILREIGGDTMVIPSGAELDLNMMVTLNDTGAFLWKQLQQGVEEEELLQRLLAEYDVDEQTAKKCMEEFMEKLDGYGFLAE